MTFITTAYFLSTEEQVCDPSWKGMRWWSGPQDQGKCKKKVWYEWKRLSVAGFRR